MSTTLQRTEIGKRVDSPLMAAEGNNKVHAAFTSPT